MGRFYEKARPGEMLAISGLGIEGVKWKIEGWIFPGQTCLRVNMHQVNYALDVQAMSADKQLFLLPVVFAVGPLYEDNEALCRYAKLISSHGMLTGRINEKIVQHSIEHETRAVAATFPYNMLDGTGNKDFRRRVMEKVQTELDAFGLHLFHASMEKPMDSQALVEGEAELQREVETKKAKNILEEQNVEAIPQAADALAKAQMVLLKFVSGNAQRDGTLPGAKRGQSSEGGEGHHNT